uniref:Uncharacterized protein n=1 Tax=Pararge aegeria TaxID=116150 RepID=S4PNH3_9NEOP
MALQNTLRCSSTAQGPDTQYLKCENNRVTRINFSSSCPYFTLYEVKTMCLLQRLVVFVFGVLFTVDRLSDVNPP